MTVFIDCGGNHGQSVIEAKRLFGDIEIYSFEPVPYLFKKMLNRFHTDRSVHLIEAAVSHKNGVSKLYLSNRHADGSSLTMTDADRLHDLSRNRYINVKTIRLSRFLAEKGLENVILKLDIEGAEYDVLNDLIETNEIRRISKIFVEWHIHNAVTTVEQARVRAVKTRITNVCANLNIPISEWSIDTKYGFLSPNRFPSWLKLKWAIESIFRIAKGPSQ